MCRAKHLSQRRSCLFGHWLFNRSIAVPHADLYFERPELLDHVHSALKTRRHVVLFGRTKHGKSALLRKAFDAKSAVTITAFPDIKFADIFRTYLMTLGCSITVESTRKKSIGSKAEVKFPWPPLLPGASLEGQYEGAVTMHNFTADINSANDICYLLRQMRSPLPLVIDHFEQLGRKQRALLIDALPMMFEAGMPQIVLVASTPDLPLDYSEQNRIASCILPVYVPPLSRVESDRLVDREFARLESVASQAAKDILYTTFDGAIGPILDACALVADAKVSTEEQILTTIHDQTRRTFLSFLSAIIDRAWTFSVSIRKEPGSVGAADPAATTDEVFEKLKETIDAGGADETQIPEAVRPLVDLAVAFGRQILSHDTNAEPARFVAFALDRFIESPLDLTDWQYAPVTDAGTAEINLGAILCALLHGADSARTIVLTRDTLQECLHASGYLPEDDLDSTFASMMKRVRRLGRRLRIDSTLFVVNDELTKCTLWDERCFKVFGDVTPQVKALLDEIGDEDEEE